MTWRNTDEGRFTRDNLAGGEWQIQKFPIGSHAQLFFLPTGPRVRSGAIAIALCESVAEARVMSHALDASNSSEVGSPLEQLFDAGYVQDKRLPKSEQARCTIDLARRPGAKDPVTSNSLIWMTRRDGTLTIAIDEDGDIPLLTCRYDGARGELDCGSVFYRTKRLAIGGTGHRSVQPSIELHAYLQVLAERENLNGSHLAPLQDDQYTDLADKFAAGHYPVTTEDLLSPRL